MMSILLKRQLVTSAQSQFSKLTCAGVQQFSTKSKLRKSPEDVVEDFDVLLKKMQNTAAGNVQRDDAQIIDEQSEGVVEQTRQDSVHGRPWVHSQKDDVLFIREPSYDWKYMNLLRVGSQQHLALNLAIQEDQAIALMLKNSQESQLKQEVNHSESQVDFNKVHLSFGGVTNCLGEHLSGVQKRDKQSQVKVDLDQQLSKAPYKRKLVADQLYSGYMRVDMVQPMLQGNFIVFKGERGTGKTSLAMSTIQQFLSESQDNKAIYVGLNNSKTSKTLFEGISQDQQSQLMCVSVGDQNVSDAEYFIAPLVALKAAKQQITEKDNQKLLFVFDDVVIQQFKEKYIFSLAHQPFAPVNILNELMENTGIFPQSDRTDNSFTMSSIVIMDTNSNTLQFQKDEDVLQSHLESIADQVIDFTTDEATSALRGRAAPMPILAIKNPQRQLCISWQEPYLRQLADRFSQLTSQIDQAHFQHNQKKQMSIVEDPWDNYLYHDSKYLLPLICHQNQLPIEQQVLIALFMDHACQEQQISQYRVAGQALIRELVHFVTTEMDQETDLLQQIRNKIKPNCSDSAQSDSEVNPVEPAVVNLDEQIQRAMRMFYLHMRVQNKLKPFKEDYFSL